MAEENESDLPDDLWLRMLKGYDDPRNAEAPAEFDFIDAKERFLAIAQAVSAAVGAECDVEVWPFLPGAAFHGLAQLPPASTGGAEVVSLRASNFGNLVTLYPTEGVVAPAVRAAVRAACESHGYRYVPSRVLLKPYTGQHADRGTFRKWGERYFEYV